MENYEKRHYLGGTHPSCHASNGRQTVLVFIVSWTSEKIYTSVEIFNKIALLKKVQQWGTAWSS